MKTILFLFLSMVHLQAADTTNETMNGILRQISSFNESSTRRDLEVHFTEQGGFHVDTRHSYSKLYSISKTTYVSKDCPYITIDVEFVSASEKDSPNDVIRTIDTPVLAAPIHD